MENMLYFLYILIILHKTKERIKMKIILHNYVPECQIWLNSFSRDYYVLNYVSKGHIYWQQDKNNMVKLAAPSAFWTIPGHIYNYGSKNNSHWEHRCIGFKNETLKIFSEIKSSRKNHYQFIKNPERFTKAFDELLDYVVRCEYGTERAFHLLEGLFLQLNEQQYSPPPESLYSQKIKIIIEEIQKAPHLEYNFADYAKDIGLSYSHFRKIFREQFRHSPQQYLIKSRLEKAALFLRTTQTPIKEISDICGISDIYYFSKLFAQEFKIPPGKYRKRFQFQ